MEGSKQEFNGPVGDVAGRDVVNHVYSHGRLLTKDERLALNSKVNQLADEYGEAGWKTWKFLHRTIGVENIDSMCIGHRDAANTILDLLLEKAKLQNDQYSQQVGQEDAATALADLVMQNSDLTAKLQQAQQAKQELKARIGEADKAYAALDTRFKQQATSLNEVTNKLHRALESSKRMTSGCATCLDATKTITRTRKRLIASVIALVISIAAAGFLGYRGHVSAIRAEMAESRLQVCEYGGHPYTVGSIIDNPQASDVECVARVNGEPPQWKTIKPSKPARAQTASPRRSARAASKRRKLNQQTPQEEPAASEGDARIPLF